MRFFGLKAIFTIILLSIGTIGSASADNLDRRVRIINNTGFTIERFYGSHTDAKTWQEDILGDQVLPSGNSVVVNFDDGTGYCIFDIRAEFEDGDVVEERDLNICQIGTYTYN